MPAPIRLASLALFLATPALAEGPVQTPPKPAAVTSTALKAAASKPVPPKPAAKPAEPKAAAPKPPAPKPEPPPPQPTFDVLQEETRLWRAISSGDQSALGALLADDVVVVGRNGMRGKAELLASITACAISGVEIVNPRVRPLTTDTIALAYRIRYRATCVGEPIMSDLNETSVWMRWGPSWRLMMHSETVSPIAP